MYDCSLTIALRVYTHETFFARTVLKPSTLSSSSVHTYVYSTDVVDTIAHASPLLHDRRIASADHGLHADHPSRGSAHECTHIS